MKRSSRQAFLFLTDRIAICITSFLFRREYSSNLIFNCPVFWEILVCCCKTCRNRSFHQVVWLTEHLYFCSVSEYSTNRYISLAVRPLTTFCHLGNESLLVIQENSIYLFSLETWKNVHKYTHFSLLCCMQKMEWINGVIVVLSLKTLLFYRALVQLLQELMLAKGF